MSFSSHPFTGVTILVLIIAWKLNATVTSTTKRVVVNIVTHPIHYVSKRRTAEVFVIDVINGLAPNPRIHFTLTICEGSEFVEIHPLPLVGRAVVTLGTLKTLTSEDVHRQGHVIERHSLIANVVTHSSIALLPGNSFR